MIYFDYQEHASTCNIVMFNNKFKLKCQHHLYIYAVMCAEGEMHGCSWLRSSMHGKCTSQQSAQQTNREVQQTKREVHLCAVANGYHVLP